MKCCRDENVEAPQPGCPCFHCYVARDPPKPSSVVLVDDPAQCVAEQRAVAAPLLPTDDKARKALPIFDGVIMYFPLAMAAIAEVSRIGNEQHNPGEPLHWARGKSMDQFNTALRHLIDHASGVRRDSDGSLHLAKAAWRVLAALQLDLEQQRT